MDITVKRLPDTVYRAIKREAQEQGRSLNAEIIRSLEERALELERRKRLAKMRGELDRFAASIAPLPDSAPLIRADRRR